MHGTRICPGNFAGERFRAFPSLRTTLHGKFVNNDAAVGVAPSKLNDLAYIIDPRRVNAVNIIDAAVFSVNTV